MPKKFKAGEWNVIEKTFIPNSTQVHPSDGFAGHYTYAVGTYRLIETLTNEDGKEIETRVREVNSEPLYALKNPYLKLAFAVASMALAEIEREIQIQERSKN